MKKLLPVIIALMFIFQLNATAQVGVGTDNPDASAMLDVESTTKGFLLPRMTITERNSISFPATGLTIYNTEIHSIEFWDGAEWQNLSGIIIDPCGHVVEYNEVTNPTTTEIWLDRNVGAQQAATASNDYLAYGSLFQWGRLSDGHECVNWTSATSGTAMHGITSELSTTDVPGHTNFIYSGAAPNDWRSGQNNSLWQGVPGINNPCPEGFRIPTNTELSTERGTWATNDAAGAFGSPLKFTVPGTMSGATGNSIIGEGINASMWSSTISSTQVLRMSYTQTGAYNIVGNRVAGHSVRCIKD